MSELSKELEEKARAWRAEAEVSTEQWRPMCEMLANEYDRLARERVIMLGNSTPPRSRG